MYLSSISLCVLVVWVVCMVLLILVSVVMFVDMIIGLLVVVILWISGRLVSLKDVIL